jgi:hypothetical protein
VNLLINTPRGGCEGIQNDDESNYNEYVYYYSRSSAGDWLRREYNSFSFLSFKLSAPTSRMSRVVVAIVGDVSERVVRVDVVGQEGGPGSAAGSIWEM